MTRTPADCRLCQHLSSAAPEEVVHDDGTWVAFMTADVPGWINLAVREHVEGIEELSDEHAAAFGPLARNLGAAIKQTTGADRLQLAFLGDNARHFHLGFFPLADGQSGLFDAAGLAAVMSSSADAGKARTTAQAIRAAAGGG